MNLKQLKEPFTAGDIEWRVQSSGKKNGKYWCMVLAYVTNRAIMDRLDEVCGAENWQNEYAKAPEGGIICGISIKCGSDWITKWDGATNTEVKVGGKLDESTNVKGGLSSAMKRAGVQWGIGRYLYHLDATFGTIAEKGKFSGKTKDNEYFKWNPPALPKWALPDGEPEIDGEKTGTEKIKDKFKGEDVTPKDPKKLPKQIQDYFKAMKWTMGEAREWAEEFDWDEKKMRDEVNSV